MLAAASLTGTGVTVFGDGVQLNGIDGDVYVLSLSYPSVLPPGVLPQNLGIFSRTGTTGAMDFAVTANSTGIGIPTSFPTSFSSYLALHPIPVVGTYGVDTTTQTVWAVLDH